MSMSLPPLASSLESLNSDFVAYLERIPEERLELGRLLEQLDAGGGSTASVLDRKNIAGHCTSRVLVLNRPMTHEVPKVFDVEHGAVRLQTTPEIGKMCSW
ncbi:hypothetical protein [Hydrogenophaga sp.]|uniref:hypothetical protein n=1 Tax=Hydrogenophaga sp. TaxID=1904254 RepID=UPI003F6FF438